MIISFCLHLLFQDILLVLNLRLLPLWTSSTHFAFWDWVVSIIVIFWYFIIFSILFLFTFAIKMTQAMFVLAISVFPSAHIIVAKYLLKYRFLPEFLMDPFLFFTHTFHLFILLKLSKLLMLRVILIIKRWLHI